MSGVFVRGVQSHDAPVRPWRWTRDTYDPNTPNDGAHLVAQDIGKAIALGKIYGGRPDAQPDYDQVVAAVADFASGFIPDTILHASESPDVISLGAVWTGSIGPVLKAQLANLAPQLDFDRVVKDAVRKLQADSRRARDEERSMREQAEREEAEEREEGRDGPRGRMNSGHRFTGDVGGFGARYIAQAREQTRTTIARMQEANRKFREERRGLTLDATPQPRTSVAAPPKTGSMASWIGRINTANREYTARKREQELRALNGGGRGR